MGYLVWIGLMTTPDPQPHIICWQFGPVPPLDYERTLLVCFPRKGIVSFRASPRTNRRGARWTGVDNEYTCVPQGEIWWAWIAEPQS